MLIFLFLFSVLLYGLFVWFVVNRPVRTWNLNHRTSPALRAGIALIAWPLVGFLLYWLGVFASFVGQVMMLPVGVGWKLLITFL